jgi:radical SAM protein with 4Fe4S-binding SPASM domain
LKAEYKERYDKEGRPNLASKLPCETPLSLFIEPSNLCNFGCYFCPTGDPKLLSKIKVRQHLELNVFNKILNDVSKFPAKIKKLHLNKDGEPLLNPSFCTMARNAKSSNLFESVETITNASLIEKVGANKLANCGLDVIKISIYGTSKTEYKSNTKKNINYDLLVSSIKDLYNYSRDSGTKIYIKMMEDGNNTNNQFVDSFSNIADRIFLEKRVENWPEFSSGSISSLINVYKQPILKTKKVCTLPFYSLVVNATGTVSACCVDWKNELIFGDINNSSLHDIWMSDAFNEFRVKMLLGKRSDLSSCRTCKHPEEVQPDDLDLNSEELLKYYYTK